MNNSVWLAFSVAFVACVFEVVQASALPEPGMFDSSKYISTIINLLTVGSMSMEWFSAFEEQKSNYIEY